MTWAHIAAAAPDEPGDAISVLVSLLAEGECWLPELVADARDQRYSWDAIATRLATTISAAASSPGRLRHLAQPAPGPVAFTLNVRDAFITSGA